MFFRFLFGAPAAREPAAQGEAALNVEAGSSVTAGQIRILITDQGAGVKSAGQMVAAAGDFQLTSTGLLEQTGGQIRSLGYAHIQVGELVQLNAADGTASLITAGTNVHVQA
ncbi:MAG: hypothetical protein LBI48_11805, partial [Burkholderiaceae bacterium]|nr:hypothetical protein [Burkholderiaceae bacterium]